MFSVTLLTLNLVESVARVLHYSGRNSRLFPHSFSKVVEVPTRRQQYRFKHLPSYNSNPLIALIQTCLLNLDIHLQNLHSVDVNSCNIC